MKTRYYLARQGQTAGPFEVAQLKQLADSGQLKPTDLVCREGAQEWVPALSVLPFFTTSTPAAVVAPSPNTAAGPVATGKERSLWKTPTFLAVLGVASGSLFLNFVLLVLLLTRGGSQAGSDPRTPAQIHKHQEMVIDEINRLEGTYECEDGDRQKPIVAVNLYWRACTDTVLGDIAKLPKLKKLILAGTNITDAGLVHLKNLKDLQWLDLYNTYITDSALMHLKELKNLQTLSLYLTNVTDEGLVHLKELKNLQTLNLQSCSKITDGGLVHLKELKNLQTLNLSHTKVTEAGIAELQKSFPGAKISR